MVFSVLCTLGMYLEVLCRIENLSFIHSFQLSRSAHIFSRKCGEMVGIVFCFLGITYLFSRKWVEPVGMLFCFLCGQTHKPFTQLVDSSRLLQSLDSCGNKMELLSWRAVIGISKIDLSKKVK